MMQSLADVFRDYYELPKTGHHKFWRLWLQHLASWNAKDWLDPFQKSGQWRDECPYPSLWIAQCKSLCTCFLAHTHPPCRGFSNNRCQTTYSLSSCTSLLLGHYFSAWAQKGNHVVKKNNDPHPHDPNAQCVKTLHVGSNCVCTRCASLSFEYMKS